MFYDCNALKNIDAISLELTVQCCDSSDTKFFTSEIICQPVSTDLYILQSGSSGYKARGAPSFKFTNYTPAPGIFLEHFSGPKTLGRLYFRSRIF